MAPSSRSSTPLAVDGARSVVASSGSTIRELAELDPERFALAFARKYRDQLIEIFATATARRAGEPAWWEQCERIEPRAPRLRPSGSFEVSFARWTRVAPGVWFYENSIAFEVGRDEMLALAEALEEGHMPDLPPRTFMISGVLTAEL